MKFSIYHLLSTIYRYIRVWWLMSRNSFLGVFSTKIALLIFLFGKIIRFSIFLGFLYFLVSGTKTLAGYTVNQTIFFFLTFNVVDVLAQFFFREVYRFRPLVVNGGFDLVLVKPISPLFRALMGGADVIDLITIPPLLFAVFYVAQSLNPSYLQSTLYLLLVFNGFLIATAFHIAVLALGIITLEIDHTIMIYRDLTSLGRLPIDIYKEPLRSTLTYFLPIGLMISLPAKTLFGLVSPVGILSSFLVAGVALFTSLRFWKYALKFYTSASS